MTGRIIYAVDIGSIRRNRFAWARVAPGAEVPAASADIDHLISRILQDVGSDMSIAMGFEAPLFIPVPSRSTDLGRGRVGDGNRSMFALAGATVATLAVHEVAWILRAIHQKAASLLTYTLDWTAWPPQTTARSLFLWEAFVSGAAHGNLHEQDAATAAVFFRDNECNLDRLNAVTAEEPLCTLHAAALWAGWATDLDRLHRRCLVLKPGNVYDGTIAAA